ncbi:MAG: hypothetical protein A2666_04570 [Parcubacteria group bacterium RIFCSPHIGHO2_01_FULL_47_10b]|nr:MAG: hypothetical protein A2666_04570 [Parcubacteria group bacterium RIFCSPHIGHO2_01_FULL_47_10b]
MNSINSINSANSEQKLEHSIVVERLTKVYKGNTKAVNDISFTVGQGEFFGFLGPNGAGKSTTMKILSTLLTPTKGHVVINGYELGKQDNEIRKSIGFGMQGVTLDDLATPMENLVLIGVLYGRTTNESRARAEELLKILSLNHVRDRWVKNFSGGMKRRLDLAAVLMHDPKILFLDEPTEGLDPAARRVIWDYLRKRNTEGTTIFLTTHYMDEADALATRLSIIDHGTIMITGSPAELKKKVGGKTLEDVFIHYTGHTIREEEISTNAPDPYIHS